MKTNLLFALTMFTVLSVLTAIGQTKNSAKANVPQNISAGSPAKAKNVNAASPQSVQQSVPPQNVAQQPSTQQNIPPQNMAQQPTPQQNVPPQNNQLPSSTALGYDKLFENLQAELKDCSLEKLNSNKINRERIIAAANDFPEQLNYYKTAKSFIAMDNRIMECASELLTDQQTTITELNTRISQLSTSQDKCAETIKYITIASGSLLLVLILMLIKFIRAHKIFKDLYEKIYDKVIDQIADRLLMAAGIKEDDKLKEKIKKLVVLNQSRKNGEIKLKEYFRQVEVVLE